MDLPGYDAWKLATPPEYEREGEHALECEVFGGQGCTCGAEDAAEDAYDTLAEAEMSR